MLTPAILQDLSALLEEEGARVAYLFGSHARGNPGPMSDVDLAVLYGRPLSAGEALDLALAVMASASELLGQRVDVVVLDTAPPELKYAVIGEGVVLVNLDDDLRVDFEAHTVSEYLDTEYMRSVQRRYLHERLREGRNAPTS